MDYGFDLVELFDKRWTSVSGIGGPVRTAPRGPRFWEFLDQGLFDRFILPGWSLEHGRNLMQRHNNPSGDDKSFLNPDLNGNNTHFNWSSPPKTSMEIGIVPPSDIFETMRAAEALVALNEKQTKEWTGYRQKMDEDSYSRQVQVATANNKRKIASSARLGKIVEYLDKIDALTSGVPISRRKNIYEKVRDWILEMSHSDVVAEDLEQTQVTDRMETFLSQSNSAMQTQSHEEKWLEEELTALARKWGRGDLECDPKRGLLQCSTKSSKGQSQRTHHKLDKNWAYYQSALYFGQGQLVNGQTWFSRLELMRDGVHASAYGGIAGTQDEGAYSIVMSHHEAPKGDRYANIDNGAVIEYMGTALKDPAAKAKEIKDEEGADIPEDFPENTMRSTTACTATMKKSLQTRKPVRVIRKFKVRKDSADEAIHGYRYDGLYIVVGETLLSVDKQEWRFKLVRQAGQGPLRKLNHASAR